MLGIAFRGWGPDLNYWNGYGTVLDYDWRYNQNWQQLGVQGLDLTDPPFEWTFVSGISQYPYDRSEEYLIRLEVKREQGGEGEGESEGGDFILFRVSLLIFEGHYRTTYKKPFTDFVNEWQTSGRAAFDTSNVELFETVEQEDNIEGAPQVGTQEMVLLKNPKFQPFNNKTYRVVIDAPATQHELITTQPGPCAAQCPDKKDITRTWFVGGVDEKQFEFTYAGDTVSCGVSALTLPPEERYSFYMSIPREFGLPEFWIAAQGGYRRTEWDIPVTSGPFGANPVCHCEDAEQIIEESTSFAFKAKVSWVAWLAFSANGKYESGPIGRGVGPNPYAATYWYEEYYYPGFAPREDSFWPATLEITEIPGPATRYGDLPLIIEGDCFGSGADGFATVPLFGPVVSATVEDGGSGYARLGRAEPVLLLTGAGAGTVNFGFTPHSGYLVGDVPCNLPYWSLNSATITSNTSSGWEQGQSLTFSRGSDTFEDEPATATAVTNRLPPVLAASAARNINDFGSYIPPPATLEVSVESNGDETWRVDSVFVMYQGSLYTDGSTLSFSKKPGSGAYIGDGITIEEQPVVRVRTHRGAPEYYYTGYSESGGGEPYIQITFDETTSGDGRTAYTIGAIELATEGDGFVVGERLQIFFESSPLVVETEPYVVVSEVNEYGGVTALTIMNGGVLYVDLGTIDECVVESGGRIYEETLVGILVQNGGRYYRENSSLPPLVADVTVTVSQPPESQGSGAELLPIIDTNVQSPTFGKITAISVVNGGQNYLPYTTGDFCQGSGFP